MGLTKMLPQTRDSAKTRHGIYHFSANAFKKAEIDHTKTVAQ
jgi:hypothetical protein